MYLPSGLDGNNLLLADVNECLASPCVNGNCSNTLGSYTCVCDAGWTGTKDIDECLQTSCFNNGTCVNTPGSFYCECPIGLSGAKCDLVGK